MKMRQVTPQEIKQIQLELLHEFHGFCIKHDLKYSLCAGTLLGAIRHQGYIPWDDDIDVMMPRRDYQRLLQIYHSNKYSLYHYSTQKSYMLPYAKLCDNRTILKENSVYESDYGIDIDIFPLDFFPDSVEESEKWSKHLGYLKDIITLKNLTLSKDRALVKNLTVFLGRFVLLPLPMKLVVRKVDVLAQKYADKIDGFLGNMTNGYRMRERNPMAKRLVDVDFEGKKYKAVENYDEYLKGLFNNYMELPPEEKRVSTHTITAYWKEEV